MKDTSVSKPLVTLTVPKKDLGSDDQEMLIFNLFTEVVAFLQKYYRCEVIPQIDNAYGELLDNGSWTGMIGKLHRKEVDIAVAPVIYTYERFKAVDFLSVLRMEETIILTAYSPPGRNNVGILHSFHSVRSGIWILLFLSYFAVSFCLNIGDMIAQSKPSDIRPIMGTANNLYDLLPSIFGKGSQIKIGSRFSFYLLLSFYLVSIFFILSAIQSIIQTDQVVESAPKIIETIHDLFNSDINPIIPGGTFIEYYLKNHQNKQYRELFAKTTKEKGIIPLQQLGSREVLDLFNKGEHAYIDSSIGIYWFQELLINTTGTSDWYTSRTPVYTSPFGIAIRKYLSLDVRKKLDLIVKSILENGLIYKWMLVSFPHLSSQEWKLSAAHPEGLDITKLAEVFYVYLLGILLSGSILCCEIFWSRVRSMVSRNVIPKKTRS